MRKSLTILIVIIVVPLAADAQRWSISPSIFYGTFKMSSMKELQGEMAQWNNFPARVVDNFPGNVGYNFQAGYRVSRRVEVGLRYQFTSTGGRVDYGDYSGQIRYDNLLRSNSLGIFTNIRLNQSTQWPICLSFAVGRARTDLEIISYFRLFDDSSSESYFDGSSNNFFNPAINFNRRLNDRFSVGLGLGYEFQIHGGLLGDDITAEWDGVRIASGLTFVFGSKKE